MGTVLCLAFLYWIGATGLLPESVLLPGQIADLRAISLLTAVILTSISLKTMTDYWQESRRKLAMLLNESKMVNLVKSKFLTSMSHELRTPLNAVPGFAHVLQLDSREPLTEKQQHNVDHIIKSGRHLLGLINDVLDLVKIEEGKLKLTVQAVNPTAVVDDCLIIAQSIAEQQSISVMAGSTVKDLPTISADLTGLKQVLLNLLSNAVKFNRDAGTVTVDAEKTTAGMLRISVSDSGPGIAKKDHAKVFEPFDRLGRESMNIEGTRIGLVISKRLMKAMAGVIGCESDIGKGSTFWIELPLAEDVDPGISALDQLQVKPGLAQPLGENTPCRRVLYIEDDSSSAELMRMIFKNIPNVELVAAADAEQGIVLANSVPPPCKTTSNVPGTPASLPTSPSHSTSRRSCRLFAVLSRKTARILTALRHGTYRMSSLRVKCVFA